MSFYGKLNTANLDGRVHRLWLSRNQELPLCQRLDPPDCGIEDRSEAIDEGRKLFEFMDQLVERHELNAYFRLLIVMHLVHGMSFQEINTQLGGRSADCTKGRYLFGLKKVKRLWLKKTTKIMMYQG